MAKKKKAIKTHTFLIRYRRIKTLHIGVVLSATENVKVIYATKGKMVAVGTGYTPKDIRSILRKSLGKIKVRVKQIA